MNFVKFVRTPFLQNTSGGCFCYGEIKRGTNLGFNVIRVLKKNVLTFCLHKVLIKCRVSIKKSFTWFCRLFSTVDEPLTSFSKEIFSIYFEHNRNSIES